MIRSGLLLLSICILGLPLACRPSAGVQRRHGEAVEVGRRVPPEGYAYFAQAVVLERQGNMEAAREAYRRARSADPASGAAWAGLAKTYCTDDPDEAKRLFERGLTRAAERYPIYLTRSACHLEWQTPTEALKDARQAMRLGPDRPEASEAVARAAEALGDPVTAEATRRGFRLYQGLELQTSSPPADRAAVDQALSSGDLDLAQTLSSGLLSAGVLALRALALGERQLARAQVDLVLAASPRDPDGIVAEALLEPRFVDWRFPPRAGLSPLGTCLYAGHLATWTGRGTARLFLSRASAPPLTPAAALQAWRDPSDVLLRQCSLHLEELLGGVVELQH